MSSDATPERTVRGSLAVYAERRSLVMLALGFLLMIGMVLIAEGFGVHVPKGYIYAAMAFSALVEGLNMMSRAAAKRKAAKQPPAAPTLMPIPAWHPENKSGH